MIMLTIYLVSYLQLPFKFKSEIGCLPETKRNELRDVIEERDID